MPCRRLGVQIVHLRSFGCSVILVLISARSFGAGKAVDGVVNLNTAPPEVLELLPGIGPAKVQSILAYRRRRPFRTVDELVRIKGIGRRMVRALRPHLAVSGPTTATAAPRGSLTPLPPPAPPPPRPVAKVCVAPAVRPPQRAPPAARASAVPLAARGHCLRPP
jgi:competence ComEA-like helix-hairpin-helix protein